MNYLRVKKIHALFLFSDWLISKEGIENVYCIPRTASRPDCAHWMTSSTSFHRPLKKKNPLFNSFFSVHDVDKVAKVIFPYCVSDNGSDS